MLDKLDEIKTVALNELEGTNTLPEIEEWRIRYLGKKGALTQVLRSLGALPAEERRSAGAAANRVKGLLESGLAQRTEHLKEAGLAASLEEERIDVTLPGYPVALGRYHPVTQAMREICDVFVSMGFEIVEGPEVEWDYYSFEALNIPKEHPARDMWSTLWIDYHDEKGEMPMLLRPH